MLLLGLLLTAVLLVSMLRVRRGNGNGAQLGRMSEQWLAAQRSARSW